MLSRECNRDTAPSSAKRRRVRLTCITISRQNRKWNHNLRKGHAIRREEALSRQPNQSSSSYSSGRSITITVSTGEIAGRLSVRPSAPADVVGSWRRDERYRRCLANYDLSPDGQRFVMVEEPRIARGPLPVDEALGVDAVRTSDTKL